MLALETRAVADARRLRAAFDPMIRSVRAFGEAIAAMMRVVAEAVVGILRLITAVTPEGYYWCDGKMRRDHSYFRQRAKDRRKKR